MTDLAVVHPTPWFRGGALAVCMHVLEALQDDYAVTLLSPVEPDLAALNDFVGTDVDDVHVRRPNRLTGSLHAGAELSNSVTGFRFDFLQECFFYRQVKRVQDQFDLVVCTRDEVGLDVPSVQYIHVPGYGLLASGGRGSIPEEDANGVVASLYDRFCLRVAGFDRDAVQPDVMLTNSHWTAALVQQVYGQSPGVLYPPIATDAFDSVPWAERENGFLTIGQISPLKNTLRNVAIVTRLRDRGHDVHLHVIGPHDRSGSDYVRRVERAARDREFVHLEGEVEQELLADLIATHRYGLHGKECEHFGMAVAEFVAGGALPFVPRSGGQTEIVLDREELTYADADEAVERIDAVLSSPERQAALREALAGTTERYSRARFEDEFRTIVDGVVADCLDGSTAPPDGLER